MKTILFILKKEFTQIFRNKVMLPLIFILPIVQLLVLVYAATLEMKNINMFVVDQDMSSVSRKLINKFSGSPFFNLNNSSFSLKEAEKSLLNNQSDIILYIPKNFEKKLVRENKSKIQLLINAINGTKAGLSNAYATSIIADFNQDVMADYVNIPVGFNQSNINVQYSFWYNSELNYKIYMLPGILVILITIIGMFLSSLNLVREKEMGTIEQINVTPIRKYQFIIGKLVPFWCIALFELGFGLIIGRILFHIPMLGNLFLLFGFASVYLLVVLGLGLLISTYTNTQQQVMFITFFFLILFILMSGIFTPTESMPQWAQYINIINPFYYFMKVIRMVLLKGSGFMDILQEFVSLTIYAVVVFSLAVRRYRKVS